MNILAFESNRISFASSMSFMNNGRLKSTQEKMQRMQKTASQVEFYEQQKANLKNIECNSIEAIARKLDMFHAYEAEIVAAKMSYNNEQKYHIMEEAKEKGEKIAEATEKMEPKTKEERTEEVREEALGTDEDGALSEAMDELQDVIEELEPKVEDMFDETKQIIEQSDDKVETTNGAVTSERTTLEACATDLEQMKQYKRMDIRI